MQSMIKTKLGITLAGVLALTITSAHADTFGSGANTFTIDFVTVGDPGNPNDTGTTGISFRNAGAVAYTYQMGTYSISRGMVTKANASVASGGGNLGITMFDYTNMGGNIATHPAAGVSWDEAARFVNWLNTSSGYSPAYKFALNPGDVGYIANANILAWTPGDAGYNAANIYRNSNAHYVIPSLNEFYKAAFYSGTGTTYYDYATASNTLPTAVASGTAAGTVVYGQAQSTGPADITQAGGLSHYGTMGQTGNMDQWFDAANTDTGGSRPHTGGSEWESVPGQINSGYGHTDNEGLEWYSFGFRVGTAAVPEPTSALLLLGSGAMLLLRRRRAAV